MTSISSFADCNLRTLFVGKRFGRRAASFCFVHWIIQWVKGLVISMCETRKTKSYAFVTSYILAMLLSVSSHAADGAFGVAVHSSMKAPDAQRSELDVAARLGFGSVRTDFQWKFAETARGRLVIPASWDSFVDEALKRGLKPILILDYGNSLYDGGDKPRSSEAIEAFSRYAAFVVSHYKGRVKIYEVWNEWDNTTGGFPAGSAEDYANLFRAAYPRMKAADTAATVLTGSGISEAWYEQLADAGVVSQSDGVSVHPYNYEPILAPETSALALVKLESTLTKRSGRPTVNVYVTEIGWPTRFGLRGYDPSRVADFATRAPLLISALPFVKGFFWYDLVDDGSDLLDKQHHFGLVQVDHSPKAAAAAIGRVSRVLGAYKLELAEQSRVKDGLIFISARGKQRQADDAVIAWNVGRTVSDHDVVCDGHGGPAVGRALQGTDGIVPSHVPAVIRAEDGKCIEDKLGPFVP